MIRYTCVDCNKELECLKNDVPVIHFLNNKKELGIDALRFGDIWQCKNCGYRVVLGMGDQITGMDFKGEKQLIEDENYVEVKR